MSCVVTAFFFYIKCLRKTLTKVISFDYCGAIVHLVSKEFFNLMTIYLFIIGSLKLKSFYPAQ